MHEIICDQAGECKEALDAVLYSVSGAQEQECDQCDGDLDAHGVLGCAEEVPDFEGVLDPAEEQFDLPATFVKFGDLVGWSIEIVGDDAQDFCSLGGHAQFADRSENGFLRERACRGGRWPIRSDRMGEPAGRRFSVTPASGVLTFNRVTMRQPASSSLAHQP